MTNLTQTIDAGRMNRGELWFRNLLQNNEPHIAELILMICDGLWRMRNERKFADKRTDAELLAPSVTYCLRTFQEANLWPERTSTDLTDSSILRPPRDCSRFMFDAGIKDGCAGIGVVLVNSDGSFVKARSRKLPGITDPLYAEGRALDEAVTWAMELGIRDAVFVGDALNLFQIARGDVDPPVMCAELIARTRTLSLGMDHGEPFWIPRDQNFWAHSLASYGKNSDTDLVEWDIQPSFLLSNDSGRFPEP